MTPAWLTAALAEAHPGAQVTAVRPQSLHEGTASTWRLDLTYAAGKPAGPASVCVKCDFRLPRQGTGSPALGLYRKEASVYLDVLQDTTARVPTCYAASYDDNNRGFMLMGDIFAAGGHFCDPVASLSVDQVATGVEQLAELHAATWNAPLVTQPQWMHHGQPLSVVDPFWTAQFARYDDVLAYPHANAMAHVFRDREVMMTAFNRLRSLDDPRSPAA